MTSNKFALKIASAASLVALVAVPFAVSAAPGSMASTPPRPDKTAFCARIVSVDVKSDKRLDGMRGTLSTRRVERDRRLAGKRDERKEHFGMMRENADDKRAEAMSRLEARAETDAQKAAVAAFKTSIGTAVTARRAAVDAANSAFAAGMTDLLAKRKNSLDAAVKKFTDALRAAGEKAKADCAAGGDSATELAEYQAAVKAAKDALKADRSGVEKIGEGAKTLVATHRAALDSALATFKTATEAARTALKAAFPPKE